MNQYKVYRHRRKDNLEVFYIGMCKNKYRPTNMASRTEQWKNVYKETDVIVDIVSDSLNKLDAIELEMFLISQYDGLVNQYGNGYSVWNKGLKMDIRHKEILSKNSGQAKMVLDLITGIYYVSAIDAAQSFELNYNTLRGKLNGTRTNNTNLIYV